MEGGKWGLIIVFSAFMIQFLAMGISGAIGVYNIEFFDYFFQDSIVQVSLIGSINFGMLLATGPVVSFLMTKMSYRKVAILGAVLIVVGLLGVPLLPYIPAMCISFGVLTGFGSCCIYIPSHVLSGLYYDKYRSFATGVATSGSGLGGAVMPVLCGVLIEYYSWKGSFIFLAGLCLHLFVLSALLRDPPPLATKEKDLKNQVVENDESQKLTTSLLENENMDGNNVNNGNEGRLDEALVGLDMMTVDSIDASNGGRTETSEETNVCLNEEKLRGSHEVILESDSYEDRLISIKGVHLSPLSKLQSVSVSSLHSLGGTRGSSQVVINESRDKNSSELELPSCTEVSGVKKVPNASRHIYIFTSYSFDIFFISNIMWNASVSIGGSFIPKFLTDKGLSAMDAAWLSGALGFGIFVGGILGGLFGNFKWVNRQALYIASNLIMGSFLLVFPFLGNVVLYSVCLVLEGLVIGVILGLLLIVLTDIVGVESLGNGLGYLMLSNGLGTFSGPPLGGALKEMTGGFESAIILAGILAMLGGVIMFLMPCKQVCITRCKNTTSRPAKP